MLSLEGLFHLRRHAPAVTVADLAQASWKVGSMLKMPMDPVMVEGLA